MPSGTLQFVGDVIEVPAALRREGVERAVVHASSIELTLTAGSDWRISGAGVRRALLSELNHADTWVPRNENAAGAVLADVIDDVLSGPAADGIRAHGGGVRLVRIQGETAVLEMSGACVGCPALGLTLHGTLEREVRRRYPALVSLDVVSAT